MSRGAGTDAPEGERGPNFNDQSIIKSPDGRFLLQSACAKKQDATPCAISVTDTKSSKQWHIYDFDKEVSWNGGLSILWSPGSRAVIFNETIGTNLSKSHLFILLLRFEQIDLSEKASKAHPADPRDVDGHIYSFAARWLDDNRILFKVTGHQDSGQVTGFSYRYVYDLRTGAMVFKKHLEHCDQKNEWC